MTRCQQRFTDSGGGISAGLGDEYYSWTPADRRENGGEEALRKSVRVNCEAGVVARLTI
jgi:hypothetical protein